MKSDPQTSSANLVKQIGLVFAIPTAARIGGMGTPVNKTETA